MKEKSFVHQIHAFFGWQEGGGSDIDSRTLKERYEFLFQIDDLKNCKDIKEVLKIL